MTFFLFVLAVGWLMAACSCMRSGGVIHAGPGNQRISDWVIAGAAIETVAVLGLIACTISTA